MDHGQLAFGTWKSVSTWMMMMLTRVKVRVGPSQGEALQALGGPSGQGHGGWAHIEISESHLEVCVKGFADLVLKTRCGQFGSLDLKTTSDRFIDLCLKTKEWQINEHMVACRSLHRGETKSRRHQVCWIDE